MSSRKQDNGKLRKYQELHLGICRLFGKADKLRDVVRRICHPNDRGSGGDLYKTVFHAFIPFKKDFACKSLAFFKL